MGLRRTLRKNLAFPPNLIRIWLLGAGIGTAIAAYSLASATRFLNNYGVGEFNHVFFEAGVLTCIVYAVYNRLHTYRSYAFVSLFFAFAIMGWVGFISVLHFAAPKAANSWAYLSFLLNFPIVAICLTIFWSVSERVLTSLELKSYRLVLNMGVAASQVLTWGAMSFFLSYSNPNANTILYATSLCGGLLAIGMLIYFVESQDHLQEVTINAQDIAEKNSLYKLLSRYYPNRIARFVFAGMILSLLVDYLFWCKVIWDGYLSSKNIAGAFVFLANVWSISILVGFILRVVAYPFLVKQYGVRFVLLTAPALLLVPMAICLSLEIAALFSDPANAVPLAPDEQSLQSMFNFALVVATKVIRDVFYEAFYTPSYRTYLLPIEDELRADTQIKFDGFVGGFAMMAAGTLIWALNTFDPFGYSGFISFFITALATAVGLALTIMGLQFAYKKWLKDILTNLESDSEKKIASTGFETLSTTILSKLHDISFKQLPTHLNILRIINPLDFRKAITKLIDSPDEKLQKLRAKLLEEIERIVGEFRKDLQNTRAPENIDEITTLVYRHTRKLAYKRKKDNMIPDEKLDNIIRFIDERVFNGFETNKLPPRGKNAFEEIAEHMGAKVDADIFETGHRMYKSIQHENIEIKEKHQVLALAEAEKNCSLEIIEILYILIHSKYFPLLQHADIAKRTYDFLRGAEYRLERVKYIEQLTLSKLVRERIFGAILAGYAERKMRIRLLTKLLQDEDATVRYYAVLATSGADLQDTYQILVEKLGQAEYANIAFASFVSAGEASLETLEQVFHFAGQKEVIQRNIIYIFGYVGTPRAIELLLLKIKHSNLNLRMAAISMLSKLGVKVPTDYRRNINMEIEEVCRNLVWNISAMLTFQYFNASAILIEAMEDEMKANYNQIFDYLMLIYDAATVKAVRDNLQSGNANKEDFAAELLDIFLDETSKPLLIPLLSPNGLEEKLKAVEEIFPAEQLPLQETLRTLLQRGFREINSWTRACALEELAQLAKTVQFEPKGYDIFVANIVNPDMVLSELSAHALKRTQGEDFGESHTVLRQTRKYKAVNTVIEKVGTIDENKAQEAPILRFGIAKFMREIPDLKKINGVLLSRIASTIEPMHLQAGETLGEYFDWLAIDYFVIFSGEVELACKGEQSIIYGAKTLVSPLPLFYSDIKPTVIRAKTESMVYKIPRTVFQEMLLFEEEVSRSFLNL